MTVWILLTLALGAITGTAEAPLLRAHCANSVAQSGAVAEQRVVRTAAGKARRVRSDRAGTQSAARDSIRIEIPLTGAAAARAPAPSC
jgi:hypothetical protein